MYMHVQFNDGSNPWYCINPTTKQAVQHATYFSQKYGSTVSISLGSAFTSKTILNDRDGGWLVRYNNKSRQYTRLGNAINFLLKGDQE